MPALLAQLISLIPTESITAAAAASITPTSFSTFPSGTFNQLSPRVSTRNSSDALGVVCAWPVSGQYGPGSRILYYILVAACVIAHRVQWLKNACLAAALLFPAVAAIHAIVLTSNHIKGAVDMDVYGVFQFMAIGVLTAPISAKVSNTYFNDRGRNIIFLWSGLVLAGLLSLTVEFYRLSPIKCIYDPFFKTSITSSVKDFPYGRATCNLTCDPERGPISPLRRGSADDIYVIPAPTVFTFNTAMLFCAACCIPTIVTLIFVWIKIVEHNRKKRDGDDGGQQPIEGTNGATDATMTDVNRYVQQFLDVIEIPLFVAAVLAVLIIGERNFFSRQVKYMTEPFANVGQWAPIAGTGIAVLGAAYRLWTGASDFEDEAGRKTPSSTCTCCGRHEGDTFVTWERDGSQVRGRTLSMSGAIPDQGIRRDDLITSAPRRTKSPAAVALTALQGRDSDQEKRDSDRGSIRRIKKSETAPTGARRKISGMNPLDRSQTTVTYDAGNRKKVAKALTRISNYLGTAAPDRDRDFKYGKAKEYPKTPGEEYKNPIIRETEQKFMARRQADQEATALARQNSRAVSVADSFASREHDGDAEPVSPASVHRRRRRSSSVSPGASGGARRPRSVTLSSQRTSFDLPDHPPGSPSPSTTTATATATVLTTPRRRDTLEVPRPDFHGGGSGGAGSARRISTEDLPPTIVIGSREREDDSALAPPSPAIVISQEPEEID